MKARLRQEHGPKRTIAAVQSVADKASAASTQETPAPPRLLFTDETGVKAPGKNGQGIIGKTVSSELHRQIAQDEEDTRTTCREQHWTPFTSKRTMEYSPLVTIFWCRLKKVVLMRFRSLTRFMSPISAFLPRLFARVVHTIAIPVAILTGYKAIALCIVSS